MSVLNLCSSPQRVSFKPGNYVVGINELIGLKEVGKGLMRAYFSFRIEEAEEDAQERGRGGPKCPPVITGALSSFERRQEKKTTNWSKMSFW